MHARILVIVLSFLLASDLSAQSPAVWGRIMIWGAGVVGGAIIGHYVNEELNKWEAQRAPSGTPEGNYEEGMRYLHSGDEKRGVESLKKSADLGYSPAECRLGDLAYQALDYPKAREWYQRAAQKNHSWAQFQLGNLASLGYLSGGRPDYESGLYWYRRAAAHRGSLADSRAEFAFGSLLLSGAAHPPSESEKREAAEAILDAANRGLPEAQGEMSYILGLRQDFCGALKWAQIAAQKNVAAAVYNLGVAYHNGDCVTADNLIAVDYYRRATQLGYPLAGPELIRTENYLKEELRRLSQAPVQMRTCSLSESDAPMYDISANVTGRFSGGLTRAVTITAEEAKNDFVAALGGFFLPRKYVNCLGLNLKPYIPR